MDNNTNRGFAIGIIFMILVMGFMVSAIILRDKLEPKMLQEENYCLSKGYDDYVFGFNTFRCIKEYEVQDGLQLLEIKEEMKVNNFW